jgi:hypothetical protein
MAGALGDEIAVLLLVAERLDAAGIAYMLSGSLALGYYAQPRMTRDLDIVVALDGADAERLTALFADDFLCEAEAVREAVRHAGMFNIIHTTRIVKVDFIVRKDTPYRREELARRRRVTIHGTPVAIVAPEDLLLSKLHWAKDSHSALQLGDVRTLIAAVPGLDWAYVERWAPTLSVTALLAEVRR